jgi:PPIC-type peptidyl-prolyl cis-trans isomerase-like protein
MSNQTLNRPATKRRASSKNKQNTVRTGQYRRQTARIDGRKDGKPLIFGWGGHLTKVQKNRIQTRAAYGLVGGVIIIVLGVLVFGVFQQNVIIPNQTIASVNSHNISQDAFRKLMAYNAQTTWNQYTSLIQQQNQLATQLAAGDPRATAENQALTSEIQTVEGNFSQSQLSQTTMDQLVENQLIEQGIARFIAQNPKLRSQLEPTSAAITKQLKAFQNAFPKGESYSQFLSKDNLSTSDIRADIALELRRTLMQNYLATLLVSPTRQVHLRRIETTTAAQATKVLKQLDANKITWTQAAKQYSLDPNTKGTSGDMGWVSPGTGDAGLALWAFASGRKVNDITTTPIKDASGTFDIVQVLGIDPNRTVDATTLQNAKSDALTFWLSGERASPANRFTTPNSDMMSASRNMPTLPNLNATLKNENPQGSNPSVPSGTGLP